MSLSCQVLSDPESEPSLKLLSVIAISNTVKARSSHHQKFLTNRWNSQDADMRRQIRDYLLGLLGDNDQAVRQVAVKAISAIAISEIPLGQWTELIEKLVQAVASPQTITWIRVSSIGIIGEICQELSHECQHLAKHTDAILTAIAVAANDQDLDLRIGGLTALKDALKFCSANFQKEDECKFLMSMMCTAATPQPFNEKLFDKQFKLQAIGWECLSGVIGYFYDILQPFMIDIFMCSVAVIKQSLVKIEDQEILEETQLASIQAIEFWYSLAINEEQIQAEMDAAEENEEETTHKNLHYIQHALPQIAPLLLQCMCLQGDDAEDDRYNITFSALNCLSMFAQQCDKQVFTLVLPQVEQSIASQDWRFRDAALTALGCIIESPSVDTEVEVTLAKALVAAINLTKDQNPFVATSAAWVIKQYCRHTPILIFSQMQTIMDAILPLLANPRNRQAENICQAIYELCDFVFEEQENADETLAAANKPQTHVSIIAPYFQPLVTALLSISEHSNNATLLMNSYEALALLIQCGAGDGNPNLSQLLEILGGRLHSAIQQYNAAQTAQTGADVGSYKALTQGLICVALSHLIYKLPPTFVQHHAANLLTVFTSILSSDPSISTEALTGIEALIYTLGKDFIPHIEATYQRLLQLIQSNMEAGALVSRAFVVLGAGLSKTQHCSQAIGDAMVQVIFSVLIMDTADRSGKLSAIDLFIDLIEVCNDAFLRYLEPVTNALLTASKFSLTSEHQMLDMDLVDYLLRLQMSICKAFDSFISTIGREGAPQENFQALHKNIAPIIAYAISVLQDTESTITTQDTSLNLLADIFATLPDISTTLCKELLNSPIPQIIRDVHKSTRGKAKKTAFACMNELIHFQKL